MVKERISDKLAYSSQYLEIDGAKMHYIEAGEGDPILFLHGLPTSCYVWRNLFPHLQTLGRCIAPDLIGCGHSDKPQIEYSVFDHIHYMESFINKLDLKKITLVMHGWGSVIGFDYAMRHETNCKALAFYEAFLGPLNNEEEVSLPFQEQLHILESLPNRTDLAEKILMQNLMRQLTAEEKKYYCEPFVQARHNQPILQYLKELPLPGNKTKVSELILNYSKKLSHSQLPKLMLYSVPGFITTIANIMWAKEHLPNLEIVDIGEELHLAQESHPKLMGETISVWLQAVEQMRI